MKTNKKINLEKLSETLGEKKLSKKGLSSINGGLSGSGCTPTDLTGSVLRPEYLCDDIDPDQPATLTPAL